MEQWLIMILLSCLLVQLSYWLFIFAKLKPIPRKDSQPRDHDIVVCYKNEEQNLPKSIKHLSAQGCHAAILVDDFSSDDSFMIASAATSSNLKNVKATVDRPGKKRALLDGIICSEMERIVLTDADCRPVTADWSAIMASYLHDCDAVIGYAPLAKSQSWVSVFARYETYLTAIQYLSYAQIGIPYMGVGRNMAVRRSTALPILTEMQDQKLASGDDDLLVQGLAKNGKVSTCLDPRSFVFSEPAKDIRSYIRQKARHISTATSYALVHQVLLAVFAGTHLLFYGLLLVLLFFSSVSLTQLLVILLVKWIMQMIVNRKLMYLLGEKDLWWKFPLLDIATFVLYVVLTPYLFLKNRTQWS